MFGSSSFKKRFLGINFRNAKGAATSAFAAVLLVVACQPVEQNLESTVLLNSDGDEDAVERLVAQQNTALKTWLIQSDSAPSSDVCLIPEGTQLVVDAIKPEGIGHWRVFSLSEIRLPSGEVGLRIQTSNESDSTSGSDNKTPKELLNCPLLDNDSFLVFSSHFSRHRVVDVQHEGGYLSRYAHLSSFTYSHGTYVDKGARIAAAGRTGNTSGAGITPHLHFEIRRGGRITNPQALLP